MKSFLLGLLLLIGIVVRAQNAEFESFNEKQGKLFYQAYEQRNPQEYEKLMKEYLAVYNKLDQKEQKQYAREVASAYYDLSCTYSLLNDKKPAIERLEKSIAFGWYKYSHIQQDSDLDNIRNEDRFKAAIEPLRKVGDYLYILRNAAKYNPADQRSLPKFTYQPADDPNLVALRKAFNLDSIAGEGSDVLKILNLCHWLHTLIPHDGNHDNPVVKNAMSMIRECKQGTRGLNCRGLATVLNECYLSLGIRSRMITCLPKDSLGVDMDCHVINMVYAPSLEKWIWVDPTFDAYVMNEKGELLSIEEVRERIIEDKPLIINPNANWNNRISQEKEYYLLNYMAKNLYMLECPVNSQYDLETREQGKDVAYIQLLPLDYFKQSPDKEETPIGEKGRMIEYKTNNPALFWAKPE